MAHFAVIQEGKVINTIIADSVEIAEQVTGKVCIEYEFKVGGPGLNWTYNGTEFVEPTYEIA